MMFEDMSEMSDDDATQEETHGVMHRGSKQDASDGIDVIEEREASPLRRCSTLVPVVDSLSKL